MNSRDLLWVQTWSHPGSVDGNYPDPARYSLSSCTMRDEDSEERFDWRLAAAEFTGYSAAELARSALACWETTGRWPRDFVTLRCTLAAMSLQEDIDADLIAGLFKALKARWFRDSMLARPPAIDGWNDILQWAGTCDGYSWWCEQGGTELGWLSEHRWRDYRSTGWWEGSAEELRAIQFYDVRAWRFGGGYDLDRERAEGWLSLHAALRQAHAVGAFSNANK